MMQSVTLPMPPSANRMWATNRRTGAKFRTAEYMTFIDMVRLAALEAGLQPMTGPLVAHLRFYFARRSGDVDNRIKCSLDALNGYAYIDDGQIDDLHVYRRYDRDNPRVEVVIEPSTYVEPEPPRRRRSKRATVPATLPLF